MLVSRYPILTVVNNIDHNMDVQYHFTSANKEIQKNLLNLKLNKDICVCMYVWGHMDGQMDDFITTKIS